jgi:glucose/arabinose dehydrogenase/cytochrome c2
MPIRPALVAAILFCSAVTASAQDANAGKTTFTQMCGLCHSAEAGDNGGGQGPNLQGVYGRDAAADPNFGYTQALRGADLTWDAATLDRFLASPTTVVPGSAMAVALPDAAVRANVVAYLEAVREGPLAAPAGRGRGAFGAGGGGGRGFGGFGRGVAAAAPSQENADWKNDAPGRVHRIDLTALAAPYASSSASNFPQVVPKPEGAELKLPPGFSVAVFTTEVTGPRVMRIAPNGDIFLAETQSNRIKVLRPTADHTGVASMTTFAQGLIQPFGMQFYPAGDDPEWLYVAENNRVVRYPYSVGDTEASAVPEIVVAQLSPTAGGHYTRDLVFSRNGRQMFVSVGSASNVAEDIPKKSVAEAMTWDAEHGTGAAWGNEENRAAVLVFDLRSDEPGRIYASGIRNCVGLSLQSETGDIWCTTNERDMLGDDLVPDYSTRMNDGDFFGWPWYYMGDNEDPRLAGERPDLAGRVRLPDVPYQAHSAAVGLEFYPEGDGASQFPDEYVDDGFAVLHGSWNRAIRTGHKIVRVPIEDGEPTGEYVDFMTGFITGDGGTWGRPVSLTVASDGSLLVGDDGANLIYRISYSR